MKELSSILQIKINRGLVSLFSINKDHRFFHDLLKKHPELKDADIIAYPNIPNEKKYFLKRDGTCVIELSEPVSEFVLLKNISF